MKRISGFFISLFLFLSAAHLSGQDTLRYPLRIKTGFDLYGPGNSFFNKSISTFEGFISADIDTSRSVTVEAGWSEYTHSEYNYSYNSSGIFLKGGMDFNILRPSVSESRYYAGIGLRYGLSVYKHGFPDFLYDNYWGRATGSIDPTVRAAHFIEAVPGIRAELFKGISVGWALRVRMLLYAGTGKDVKPLYIPGYGNGLQRLSPGMNYYIIWSFRYREFR
jgi:hypothetical protein